MPAPHEYLPTVIGFPGAKVDVADPRYVSATKAASAAGLTQEQFSRMLAIEAERVSNQQAAAPAAPTVPALAAAPARAAPEVPYAEMSMSAKLAKFGHV